MTKVIFIAATPTEILAAKPMLSKGYHCFVSGIGAISTAMATINAIDRHNPDLIIQIGVAGAIDRSLSIGQVVVVGSDYQADLGAWRAEERKFVKFESEVYNNDFEIEGLKRVSARTVTTACTPLIEDCAEIETMEGAAFFAAAGNRDVRAVQIRSISNYVGDVRDIWDIEKAIKTLENQIVKLF